MGKKSHSAWFSTLARKKCQAIYAAQSKKAKKSFLTQPPQDSYPQSYKTETPFHFPT